MFHDVTLAIIAGGKGSRLGGIPKGLLVVEGRPILERILDLAPLFPDVLLVANEASVYARYARRTVEDEVKHRGAPGGVHAALAHARTPWICAVACDMPFITREAIAILADARDANVDAVCFEANGRLQPLLGIYRTGVASWWRVALENAPSFQELFHGLRTRVVPEERLRAVDPSFRVIENINTPGDCVVWGAATLRTSPCMD